MRCDPPEILSENFQQWTNELIYAIDSTSNCNFSDLTLSQKVSLIKRRFRNCPEIKETLFRFSNEKCAYCETIPTSGRIQRTIDHFNPISLYPHLAFTWENLLPSCHDCNSNKHTLDTVNEPIVDPSNDDPSDYFTFNILIIEPLPTSSEVSVAQRTITELNLNSKFLIKKRSSLAKAFSDSLIELERVMKYLDRNISNIDNTWERNFVEFNSIFNGIVEEIDPNLPFLTYKEFILENNSIYRDAQSKRAEYEEIISNKII